MDQPTFDARNAGLCKTFTMAQPLVCRDKRAIGGEVRWPLEEADT